MSFTATVKVISPNALSSKVYDSYNLSKYDRNGTGTKNFYDERNVTVGAEVNSVKIKMTNMVVVDTYGESYSVGNNSNYSSNIFYRN